MAAALDPTFTLADLQSWPARVETWPAKGIPLAVIGRPVAHSLSPVMHNSALAELADTSPDLRHWRYFKFDLAPEELPVALDLFHRHRFRGLNLTVPHKALVVPLLESKNAFVQSAGAANTLLATDRGWKGFNTDGYGLSAALREDLGVNLAGTHVVLLGAGGAARGAAVECLSQGCASLWIGNRTRSTADALRESLRDALALHQGVTVASFDVAGSLEDLPSGALVINATSLGLKADDPAPIDLAQMRKPAHVFDMIYRPSQTALLRRAAELQIPSANGLSMLVHQGAASLEIWTGRKAPVATMQRTVRTALGAANA